MKLNEDENGQGSAEYILLFGAIIVVAIAALIIYGSYFSGTDLNSTEDIKNVRNNSVNSGGSSNPPNNDIPPSEP
ncbi:MAG: class III signal peptide-containing protein [Methanomicrobiales archaeon]